MKILVLLLPIAAYFLAEQLAGAGVAMAVGVVLSVVMAVVEARRTGSKIDWKDVVADCGLIVVFGVTDVVLDRVDPGLKPVGTSAILAVFMAVTMLPGVDLMGKMAEKINPSGSKNPYIKYLVRGSQKRMLGWIVAACLLYTTAYVWPETRAARWIDSYLIVTLMTAYFATEIVVSRIRKRKYAGCEWVMTVDEEGMPTGGCPRPLVHNGSKWLHAVVHLHIIDRGRLLLQLRPKTKRIQGGKWDTAVGGHIAAGENIEKALARETMEETGLKKFEAKMTGRYVWESDVEKEYVFQFITESGGPFKPVNEDEIEDLRFWSVGELEAAIGTGVMTPNLENELCTGLLERLKNY